MCGEVRVVGNRGPPLYISLIYVEIMRIMGGRRASLSLSGCCLGFGFFAFFLSDGRCTGWIRYVVHARRGKEKASGGAPLTYRLGTLKRGDGPNEENCIQEESSPQRNSPMGSSYLRASRIYALEVFAPRFSPSLSARKWRSDELKKKIIPRHQKSLEQHDLFAPIPAK